MHATRPSIRLLSPLVLVATTFAGIARAQTEAPVVAVASAPAPAPSGPIAQAVPSASSSAPSLPSAAGAASPSGAEASTQTEPAATTATPRPSRFQVNLTGGVAAPGEMTPKEVFRTHAGAGPLVRAEFTLAPVRFLEIGSYVSFSNHPISTIDGDSSYDGSGSVQLLSAGATIKARWTVSRVLTLRGGAYVGAQYDNAYVDRKGGGEGMPGFGLGLGAIVDGRFTLAEHLALIVQLGFLSQPVGSVKFPGDSNRPNESVGFEFLPMPFITVGPEFFAG